MDYTNNNNKMAVVVFERDTTIRRLPEEEIDKVMDELSGVSAHANETRKSMIVHLIFPNYYLHPTDAKRITAALEEAGGKLLCFSRALSLRN